MYIRHFECVSASVCVCVCAQEFKFFHYSAQLILLQCVSSFNLIIPSLSPSLHPIFSFLPSNLFHSLFLSIFLMALLSFKSYSWTSYKSREVRVLGACVCVTNIWCEIISVPSENCVCCYVCLSVAVFVDRVLRYFCFLFCTFLFFWR